MGNRYNILTSFYGLHDRSEAHSDKEAGASQAWIAFAGFGSKEESYADPETSVRARTGSEAGRYSQTTPEQIRQVTGKDKIALAIICGLVAWGLAAIVTIGITGRPLSDRAAKIFAAIIGVFVTGLTAYFASKKD